MNRLNHLVDYRPVAQAFDNIVNAAWEGAKYAPTTLTEQGALRLIKEIEREIKNLKATLPNT